MDSQGYVFLSFIAEFNRVKQLTTDMELIKLVCYQSQLIEYLIGEDGKDRLRPRERWDQWVLNKSERDVSAQNDGPEELHHPPVPHPTAFDPSLLHYGFPQGSSLASPGMSPFDTTFPGLNGIAMNGNMTPAAANTSTLGEKTNLGGLQHSASPAEPTSPVGAPFSSYNLAQAAPSNAEHDAFPNDKIDSLSIIVKQDAPYQGGGPGLPAPSRTFSNGSIDGGTSQYDSLKPTEQMSEAQANGHLPSEK
jgi:la-related protein 1